MEKVVSALWRNPEEDREGFNARLLSGLPDALRRAGASRIRVNLRDADVDPGLRGEQLGLVDFCRIAAHAHPSNA